MLNAIKNYFENKFASQDSSDLDHQLKLATAALLIEMMQQDDQVDAEEINATNKALREKFELTADECHELFNQAEAELAEAVDYHQFTRLINNEFTLEQKIKVIELLWSVAYADTQLDSLEEHMVRKVADLIYVSHKDFMLAKHRVLDTLNIK